MNGGRAATIAVCMAFAAGGGYGFGVATAPLPAVAQGPDTIDLDVYARLDALETRVTGVEDELAHPCNVVQAPFRIVGDGGRNLVTVAMEDGQPAMRIGEGIVLGYVASQPSVQVFSADGRVAGMDLQDNVATLYASQNGADGFFAGPSPQHGNSVRILEGGQPVATFGVPPGKGAGARFFTGDTLIAAIGISTEGEGLMFTGFSDGSTAAAAGSYGGGQAYVSVYNGGNVAASMNTNDNPGSGLVVVRNSGGIAVAQMAAGGAGGTVSANDASGNEVFGAGSDGAGGVACVRRPNGNQFCLEPVMPLTRQE